LNLSIVIPSHCRTDLLKLCLHSVTQCQPVDTEIIVVDDGSKNGIVSQTAEQFPGVVVVRHAKPKGFAAAANAGIARAKGTVVELLNDDAEVTPGWAEPALAQFANPAIVAVAPLVLIHPNGDSHSHPRVDSAGDVYDDGGFAQKRFHGERLSAKHFTPSRVWGVSAAAGFYRRESLMQVGGFAEEFGAYFEDVDLRERGGKIVYEPQSVVWHRVSASYGRQPSRCILEQQSRNEERLFWRSSTGPKRWQKIPRHLAVLVGKSARRLSEGTFSPWLTGRIRALISA
jgi:GT2 family glycosyltransferase